MNRDKLIGGKAPLKHDDFIHQVAYHEAGHAAAIYLRNRQLGLPPVYFNISLAGFNDHKGLRADPSEAMPGLAKFQPVLEGGLLHAEGFLQTSNCSSNDCSACRTAHEADIVNLMAGPMAEALHVAKRDGEPVNRHLLGLSGLTNYGGISDLEKVENYLDACSNNAAARTAKLNELYAAGFEFVADAKNWRAIERLALFIVRHDKDVIQYQEAIEILDDSADRD